MKIIDWNLLQLDEPASWHCHLLNIDEENTSFLRIWKPNTRIDQLWKIIDVIYWDCSVIWPGADLCLFEKPTYKPEDSTAHYFGFRNNNDIVAEFWGTDIEKLR